MGNKKDTERQILEIIATDRIDIPISSMSGKLKRKKPNLAKALELEKKFKGDRAYAYIDESDKEKARGLREGVDAFAEKYPKYGRILNGIIEEKRTKRETHLVFGMHEGCRLTSNDYMSIMTDLGFSEQRAEGLYQELMKVSRNLSKKRGNERSILIG